MENLKLFYQLFWSLTFDGIALGAIYALIALGYTLVYGVLRLINFAHSEVFMVGTFTSYITVVGVLGITEDPEGMSVLKLVPRMLLPMLLAMIASAITAILIERIAYRRLRRMGASRLTTLITAIGVSLTLTELARIFTGALPRQVPRVMEIQVLANFFDAQIRNDKVLVIVAAGIMMFVLDTFVKRSRLGKGIRAVSMDESTSQLMGVNLDRVVVITFLLGGAMAGAAGYLYLTLYPITSYRVGFALGISAFTAAVLGGIGNLRGALLGGFALGLMEMYASAIFGTAWKAVVSFVVLVLVLLFRPNGILGEAMQQARV